MINTIINVMFMGKWIDRVYIYRASFILFDKFWIYSQICSNSDKESFARLIVSRKIHGKISKTQIRLHFERGLVINEEAWIVTGLALKFYLQLLKKCSLKNKNIQRSKIILWDIWMNTFQHCRDRFYRSCIPFSSSLESREVESRVTKSPALRNLTLYCSKMSFHLLLKRINFQ